MKKQAVSSTAETPGKCTASLVHTLPPSTAAKNALVCIAHHILVMYSVRNITASCVLSTLLHLAVIAWSPNNNTKLLLSPDRSRPLDLGPPPTLSRVLLLAWERPSVRVLCTNVTMMKRSDCRCRQVCVL